jgi:hypothetical protein
VEGKSLTEDGSVRAEPEWELWAPETFPTAWLARETLAAHLRAIAPWQYALTAE